MTLFNNNQTILQNSQRRDKNLGPPLFKILGILTNGAENKWPTWLLLCRRVRLPQRVSCL